MSDYYTWNDFSEPVGLDPWDDMWFEEPQDEEEESEVDPDQQEDFGWFGEMGLWD
jgi:hypothetical protein